MNQVGAMTFIVLPGCEVALAKLALPACEVT